MRKFIMLALLSATAIPAMAQQGEQLTPEELKTLRELAVQAQVEQTNTPTEIEQVRIPQLEEERARDTIGYQNATRRVLQQRSVHIVSGGPTELYPIQPMTLWQGTTSSVAFFDHRGQPWPVQSVSHERQLVSLNDGGCAGNGGGDGEMLQGVDNIITFTPCSFWTTTSAQVVLRGETKPIVFDLSSGSDAEEVYVDSGLSVSLQSSVGRPFGRTHSGDVDLSWIQPAARALSIDPIDTNRDRTANAIVLARDVTTDISFMDSRRTPWPISEVVYTKGIVAINGDCADEVGGLASYKPEEGVSTFWATLCKPTRNTIGVKLEGRAGAISLLALNATGPSRQPDGTLSITVSGASPSTGPSSAGEAAVAGAPRTSAAFNPDAALDDFLSGAPLEGSQRVRIGGGGDAIQGWIYNGALYVRGAFFVVNPAYDGTARSTDGTMRVWKFDPPVSRLLVQNAHGAEAVLSIQY